MKKLMIAAAIVCAAVISQAASVDWNSDLLYAPVDATGVKGEDFAAGVGFYAFVIDETAYKHYAALSYAAGSAEIWKDFGTGSAIDAAALATKAGSEERYETDAYGMSTLTETVEDKSGKHYRALILTYTDEELGDFYIANIDTVDVGGSGSYSGEAGAAGTTWAGTSGESIGAWSATSSIPEPTSGLLLLLGVAGLALRRRRA